MGIISWIVVGLMAGLLAKWSMPGSGPVGFTVTVLIGMAGASIGGFVVRLLGGTGRRASIPGLFWLRRLGRPSCCSYIA